MLNHSLDDGNFHKSFQVFKVEAFEGAVDGFEAYSVLRRFLFEIFFFLLGRHGHKEELEQLQLLLFEGYLRF